MAKRLSDLLRGVPAKRPRFSIDDILATAVEAVAAEDAEEVRSVATDDSEPAEPSAAAAPTWPPEGRAERLRPLRCRLEGKELWSRFYKLNTEMIITKSGRRMFPTVKVRLENCDPDANYYVFLDVIPVDNKRYSYRYQKSAWCTAGKAEPAPPSKVYMHPDSPYSGRSLMTQVVSFEKAKLTNNTEQDKPGHLILNSMHKYQPRVHIVRRERGAKPLDGNAADFDLTAEHYRTFVFEETQFMAVTAYQNQLITKLKIEKNPFAKGFRDPNGRGNDFNEILGARPLDANAWPPNVCQLLGQFLPASSGLGQLFPFLGPDLSLPLLHFGQMAAFPARFPLALPKLGGEKAEEKDDSDP